MKTRSNAAVRSGFVVIITLAAAAGCGGGAPDLAVSAQAEKEGKGESEHERNERPNFEIRTLSNRADLISDGDALVEVQVPRNVQMRKVTLTLNGADVGASFVADAEKGTLRGVLTGLRVGRNLFAADANGRGEGRPFATLTITNHPRGGPVLLGSQTQPWVCATPTAVPASGNTPASNASGLSTSAVDEQCNIATEYKLFYRTTTSPCSAALPDPSPPATPPANACFKPYTVGSTPADLATTTTTTGLTVPYIVRVERGTMNRGIYDIAVLFDPTRAAPWTALSPQPQWNHKVLHSFGASTGQPRLQFRTEQNWADDSALSRGFMVVDNSLTDSLFNSNRILVNETLMMMKEHIVDTYGEIAYTMGNGCSGGSIQQNTVASTFPGLLDGIQPSCDYPDSITTGLEVQDCVLLVNAYVSAEWTALMGGLTQAQINAKKAAINGHLNQLGCQSWNNAFGFNNKPGNYVPVLVVNQTTGAVAPTGAPRDNCLLPAALVYDPVTNPNGTRCGDPDLATAVWGTTANANAPGSVRARQTGDNVGIQYGLKALRSGAITAEEFVTLNEKIGGVDADSNRRAARTTADLPALDIAYRAGIVSSGKNLGKLPIIDSRGWDEQGIHYIWRSFAERARIDAANNGNHGNQVMWRYGTGLLPSTAPQVAAVTLQSLLTMNVWLDALNLSAPKETLNSVRTQDQVIAAKPANAVDFCFLLADTTFSTKIFDMAVCDADSPQGDGLGRLAKRASPRQVAGGPLTENILKCQLKPLNPADYAPATLTDAQLARLRAVFPDGVCDWTRPGVGQRDAISPLTFAAGPGGVPLPPAPVSGGLERRKDDDD
ncbi:MAG TPA: DUF6351 family protein [Myxococcales bacterium]|nr:DUF6351 family protein [Myxococcales bacterium]